jgi:hypothetical protein
MFVPLGGRRYFDPTRSCDRHAFVVPAARLNGAGEPVSADGIGEPGEAGLDPAIAARLKRDPHASTDPYKEAYLRHLFDRAQYYDGLSRTVLGRSVAHVLLLHHNLINALYLRDVIRMFEHKGWTVIDAQDAFSDPVYFMRPDIIPAGESILWALAKEKGIPGLRYPGEDEMYEKPILDRLHL